MRFTRDRILIAASLVVILALALVLSLGHSSTKRLADGSILRVQKASYGQLEHFSLESGFKQWAHRLPFFLQKILPVSAPPPGGSQSWQMNAPTHGSDAALFVYLTRRDGQTGAQQSVDINSAELIDEHGCVFSATQRGGWNDGAALPSGSTKGPGASVVWFRFGAFPRLEKSFRLRLQDAYGAKVEKLAEFVLVNPAPQPTASNWVVEPLPVTRSQEGVSYALTKAVMRKQTVAMLDNPRFVETGIAVVEDGKPSTHWTALEAELADSFGNFSAPIVPEQLFLCPRVAAWKLRAKFFGDEHSQAAANVAWTLRGLEVPGPEKFTVLQRSNVLQGVAIIAGAFGGPGIYTYRNFVPLSPAEATNFTAAGAPIPMPNPPGRSSAAILSWPRAWTGAHADAAGVTYKLDVKRAYLAFDFDGLGTDQRLTVRAVDEQGREFYGDRIVHSGFSSTAGEKPSEENYLGSRFAGEPPFVLFEFPADAKKVDITFCVHTCRTAEFIFKPPRETTAAPQ